MNWGWDFPEAPSSPRRAAAADTQPLRAAAADTQPLRHHSRLLDFNYSWGWFYAGRAASPNQPEISVIAGCGFSYVDPVMETM